MAIFDDRKKSTVTAALRRRLAPWAILTLGLAFCCTRLENGSDTFGLLYGGASAGGFVTGGVATFSGARAGNDQSGGTGNSAGTTGKNSGGAAGALDACFNPNGFNGLGCFSCEPTDGLTLENACTDATCKQFDNALRLPRVVGGKLPALPVTMAGLGGSMSSGGSANNVGSGGFVANAGSDGLGGSDLGGSGSGGIESGAGGASGSGGSTGVGFACDSLSANGTVVYVTGSSAASTYLDRIAEQLALPQTGKVFLVYTAPGSCGGVDAIVNGTQMRTGPKPLPASANYWDTLSSASKPCDLPPAGVTADLGISDVFAQSCPAFDITNLDALGIRDAHGPIQTMTFAVPANSSYKEISQQAAYMVFGFGKDGQVLDPTGTQPIWNDEQSILQRSATSGTQAMLAAAIGAPPGRWKGKPNSGSKDIAAALKNAQATKATADATIGILGADYIDANNLRSTIRMLAYQDNRQACAVTPDSTSEARDRRNVRDGHYPIWGPLHLLYKVNANGEPTNVAIRDPLLNIVAYLTGTKALPNGINLFDIYVNAGLIPECAMHVTRTADGGPIVPTQQLNPCSCRFDKAITGNDQVCNHCNVQAECKVNEICLQGWCEPP